MSSDPTSDLPPADATMSAGVAHLLTLQPATPPVDPAAVTVWLEAWSDGSAEAIDGLIPLVYRELRQIAGRLMVGEGAITLQPTSVVHEAYVRLLEQREVNFADRQHFFAIAARIMRRVILDAARSRSSWKRGGREEKVTLDEALDAFAERCDEYVALDDALVDLEATHPKRAAILELRVFGGFTQEETAEILGVSRPTVTRQYKLAKAWLRHYLEARRDEGESLD